ncbi:hypothetical protein Y032_1066g3527 [Ancylostoma ceylanicum]|uniref:Uncharacterized protein n=1 Tax=Ancylostoma ceylanicum TaxID=53326 RepID=A0A016W6C0_9BILA|nr:hypothetical protein Y032_1066g3527 [Ancylostoma ceylanicum]
MACMHEHWGGEGIGEAVMCRNHFKQCAHDCLRKESLVDSLRMSKVLNRMRSSWDVHQARRFCGDGMHIPCDDTGSLGIALPSHFKA